MQDAFANHSVGLTAPATHAEAVVPNDATDLAYATRALYVGQTGNIRVQTVAGDIVILANVQGGTLLPLRVERVFQTGTTASDLVGLS